MFQGVGALEHITEKRSHFIMLEEDAATFAWFGGRILVMIPRTFVAVLPLNSHQRVGILLLHRQGGLEAVQQRRSRLNRTQALTS